MFNNDDDDDEFDIVLNFVKELDPIVDAAMDNGMEYHTVASAMQAYITHLYTSGDNPDFDGLELLLLTVLENIQNRPRWDIE